MESSGSGQEAGAGREVLLSSLLELSLNLMEVSRRPGTFEGEPSPTMVQINAMKIISHVSPVGVSLKELSHLLKLSQGATSKLVDRMVRLGLVERVQDESDRRAVRIFQSELGRKLVTYHCEVASRTVDELLSDVPAEARALFLRLADTLNGRLWERLRRNAQE